MESIHKFIKNVKNNYIIKRGAEELVILILFVFIISISSSIAYDSFFFNIAISVLQKLCIFVNMHVKH